VLSVSRLTVVPHVSPIYRDFLAMADSADDAPVRQWYGAEPFAEDGFAPA